MRAQPLVAETVPSCGLLPFNLPKSWSLRKVFFSLPCLSLAKQPFGQAPGLRRSPGLGGSAQDQSVCAGPVCLRRGVPWLRPPALSPDSDFLPSSAPCPRPAESSFLWLAVWGPPLNSLPQEPPAPPTSDALEGDPFSSLFSAPC